MQGEIDEMKRTLLTAGFVLVFFFGMIGLTAAPEEESLPKNLRWMSKAAEQGDAEAQADLGAAYFYGRGVPQDRKTAAKWLRKSADQGFARAQNLLGRMYLKGLGVTQNSAEAAKWFRKAADQGFARGQYNLAVLY